MRITDIITETTAGGIASVAMPMGKMQRRANPSVFSSKKNKLKDGRIEDTFGTKTVDKHDKPKKKKSKAEEGKSPHKKGTKKYKKHMAAMHAETTDSYKQQMAEKLNKKLKASVTPPTAPADIKASNIQAKSLKPIKSTGGGGGGK